MRMAVGRRQESKRRKERVKGEIEEREEEQGDERRREGTEV